MKEEGAGEMGWGSEQLVKSLDFILETTESREEWVIQPRRLPSD